MTSHQRRTPGRITALVAGPLFAALALLAGCNSTPNERSTGGAPDPNVGSFSVDLTVGGGFRFGQVSYDVSGNGFHKTGSIDASGSATLSTVVGGIPLGTGYKLQVTAQDVDHKLTPCMGSASFNLPTATTVAVPVHLTCHEIPPAAPSAVPVPRWATTALAGLLLALGAAGATRRARGSR